MMAPQNLIGTWRFTRDGARAFLHFTYTQAFDYLEDGDRRQVMRLWYDLEDPGTIRFRNQPNEAGWSCAVRMEEGSLIITGEQLETVCTKATTAEIPAWFAHALETGL